MHLNVVPIGHPEPNTEAVTNTVVESEPPAQKPTRELHTFQPNALLGALDRSMT